MGAFMAAARRQPLQGTMTMGPSRVSCLTACRASLAWSRGKRLGLGLIPICAARARKSRASSAGHKLATETRIWRSPQRRVS